MLQSLLVGSTVELGPWYANCDPQSDSRNINNELFEFQTLSTILDEYIWLAFLIHSLGGFQEL